MKLTGMVLRNDDTIPEDFDTNTLVLPESVRCTVDFDVTKPIGQAKVWRDDEGNVWAEVEVSGDAEKLIMGDKEGPDGENLYQYLTCSVIAPYKGTAANVAAPSLLDVSVTARPSNEDVPPMRRS